MCLFPSAAPTASCSSRPTNRCTPPIRAVRVCVHVFQFRLHLGQGVHILTEYNTTGLAQVVFVQVVFDQVVFDQVVFDQVVFVQVVFDQVVFDRMVFISSLNNVVFIKSGGGFMEWLGLKTVRPKPWIELFS